MTSNKKVKMKTLEERVTDVLSDALGVDEEEITPDGSIIYDLGAESVDYLDILMRIEREFRIKIPNGELFPVAIIPSEYNSDEGIRNLKARYSKINIKELKTKKEALDFYGAIHERVTVGSIINYLESKTK
ncbi:acyl carrier protein [Candidatus Pacearchaeota archaeon]|nr:acyl carrier protein [Candidatus Pacearchaeota archaeon]